MSGGAQEGTQSRSLCVEEMVRGVSRGDILLTVVQIVGGGVVGYFVGLWQGRAQTQYQRRVEVVTEMRKRLREARESFGNMVTPHEWRLPGEQFRVEEVGKKLDALNAYFADNGNWLDEELYERLDNFTDDLALSWADIRGRVDAGEDPEPPLRTAWEWLWEADDEMEEINEGFDRTLGTHAPWWRRWLGQ